MARDGKKEGKGNVFEYFEMRYRNVMYYYYYHYYYYYLLTQLYAEYSSLA